MKIQQYLEKCQHRVETSLDKLLPATTKPPITLHTAMRYATLNGGKRIRAALVYATGVAFGANLTVLDKVSAALEMVHAFSLIHDDLPAIDNDSLRRGKPSCHIQFNEATAILAGDALHSLAFKTLANLNEKQVKTSAKIQMLQLLGAAVGSQGLIGGEILDIEMENKKVSAQELLHCYQLKTATLLTTSLLLGALSANYKHKNNLNALKNFGANLGLAFQIHDDIIGIESESSILGKPQNSDEKRKKPTYPSIVGMDKAKIKREFYFKRSIAALNKINLPNKNLHNIASFIVDREY